MRGLLAAFLVLSAFACADDPAARIVLPEFDGARTVLLGSAEPSGTDLVTTFDLDDGTPDFAYRVQDGTKLALAAFAESHEALRLPLGPAALLGDDERTEPITESGRYWRGAIRDGEFSGWSDADERPSPIGLVRRPKLCDEITIEDSVELPNLLFDLRVAPLSRDRVMVTGKLRGLFLVERSGTSTPVVETSSAGYDALWADRDGRIFVAGFDRRLMRFDPDDSYASFETLVEPQPADDFGTPHAVSGGYDEDGNVELFVLTETGSVAYWSETSTTWLVAPAGIDADPEDIPRTSIAWVRPGGAIFAAYRNLVHSAVVENGELVVDEVSLGLRSLPPDPKVLAVTARPGQEPIAVVSSLRAIFYRGGISGMVPFGPDIGLIGAILGIELDESGEAAFVSLDGFIASFPRVQCGDGYRVSEDGLLGPWLTGSRSGVVAEPTGNRPAAVHFFSWKSRSQD